MQKFLLLFVVGATTLPGQTQTAIRELIDGGHWKRARVLVAQNGGSDAESLYLAATVKQAYGELDAAEKFAERAIAANPKEAQYHFRLSTVLGEKAQKAGVLHQIGLARAFKRESDATLALNPNHPEALANLMQFYLQAPGIVGGDKAKAHAIPERLAAIDPVRCVQTQIELARADKQDAKIEEIIKKAVTMKAETYEAHMMVANYLARLKDPHYDDALRHAREAQRMKPDRAGAHSLIAVILARQDKWAELDAALAQAEKDVPDNLYPYFRAADVLLDRKVDLARAERYDRKYLTIEPERGFPSEAIARWRLGLVLAQQGRKPEAIAEWKTSVKLDPKSPAQKELK